MNELALFAGAGGEILGGHLLGWRTVCAVEWDSYAASVLVARQNDKVLPPFPIWDDVQTFDGHPWRGIVDVVSGGFPCQDISIAGRGDGLDGERSSMWKHMARIVGEVRPRYVYVENSPMLLVRGLDRVLADLTTLGYDARWGIVSAADVGAPHQRERIWIVANARHGCWGDIGIVEERDHSSGERTTYSSPISGSSEQPQDVANTRSIGRNDGGNIWQERHVLHNVNGDASQGQPERQGRKCGAGSVSADVADTINEGLQRGLHRGQDQERKNKLGHAGCSGSAHGQSTQNWWTVEPNVGRVADGVAARVDRLKAIGNGQVPEVARTAWNLLKGDNHG